jgi:hypothetical protein
MRFMVRTLQSGWSSRLAVAAALVLLPTLLLAADRRARAPKPGEYNPQNTTVEMFSAIEKGDIEVTLIPKDSTQARIMIANKTNKPLNVQLPAAFAGVPMLGQVGGAPPAAGGGGAANVNQQMGGGMGMGMGGMGGGMGGMGGGMFNIPAEKVGQLKAPCVCLEHGKREPKPQIKYEIRPIESITDKPAVQELCRMLGTGQVDQRAAQAAAWHLNNNMTWQQLAAKRIEHADGSKEPYFTAAQIQWGMRLAVTAGKQAEERAKQPSAGSTATSTSN